jgi:hypothetical protein
MKASALYPQSYTKGQEWSPPAHPLVTTTTHKKNSLASETLGIELLVNWNRKLQCPQGHEITRKWSWPSISKTEIERPRTDDICTPIPALFCPGGTAVPQNRQLLSCKTVCPTWSDPDTLSRYADIQVFIWKTF